ncbi:MAG: ABC transporter ATP-binding protein [Actinomycetota bacterium]
MTVVGLLIPQLRGLSRVQEYRQKQQVAVAAIRRFMDRPTLLTEPLGPRPLPPGPGRLRAHRLSIGIVDEVTVELPAGHTAAIVGPNGSGKSTLISAIARLVDLERGSVELDGTDLAEVSLADARSAIGISAPDLPLMRGSLRRNLTYRHPDAVPAELDWVIELCDLRPLIGSLPGGLDHRIEEGGTNLSSGQRQRLMLARALLGCPRLLLLDEADANLDAATTTIVDRVIAAHLGSCIVVTHRPERLAAADHVWHLDGGRLVEHGRTADLLAADSRTVALFAPDRRVSSDAHEQSPARCETRTRGLNAGR